MLRRQVATHVIGGLVGAMQAMQKRSNLAFAPAGAQRSPALAGRAAFSVAAEGIGKLLEAVNVASSMIRVRTGFRALGPPSPWSECGDALHLRARAFC